MLSFVKENPKLEGISYAAVSAYKEYCESCGVDAEIFYDAWKYKSSVKGDDTVQNSVKSKVLKYINSLALSKKQKDSLYFAMGYAESNIDLAPWH